MYKWDSNNSAVKQIYNRKLQGIAQSICAVIPTGDLRMGLNKHAYKLRRFDKLFFYTYLLFKTSILSQYQLQIPGLRRARGQSLQAYQSQLNLHNQIALLLLADFGAFYKKCQGKRA